MAPSDLNVFVPKARQLGSAETAAEQVEIIATSRMLRKLSPSDFSSREPGLLTVQPVASAEAASSGLSSPEFEAS